MRFASKAEALSAKRECSTCGSMFLPRPSRTSYERICDECRWVETHPTRPLHPAQCERRTCLGCGGTFMSEGPHHRLCGLCRKEA